MNGVGFPFLIVGPGCFCGFGSVGGLLIRGRGWRGVLFILAMGMGECHMLSLAADC